MNRQKRFLVVILLVLAIIINFVATLTFSKHLSKEDSTSNQNHIEESKRVIK